MGLSLSTLFRTMQAYGAPMTMTMSAPMTYGTAAPMTYAPTYGGYPTMQQPMMTQDIVEKQRLEATQQLSSASTMQEKILTDQYEAQVKMLDAEADRQIELTKQTYKQQLEQQKQANQMAAQAAQYKMQAEMQ